MNGQLQEGDRLPYRIPFPLGMDNLTRTSGDPGHDAIMDVIYPQVPDFDSQPEGYRVQIIERVRDYLKAKQYSAETFEKFALRGTPSTIVVDRKGVLRDVSFGSTVHLENMVQGVLSED